MVERKVEMLTAPTIKSVERFILIHQIDRSELLDLERTAATNIGLRAKYGLDVLPLAEQLMVEHIAKSIYFAAKYLNSPMPVVGILEEQGIVNPDGRYAVAAVTWPSDCPNGMISYSRYFLRKISDEIESDLKQRRPNSYYVDSHWVRSLAKESWHEVVHLCQQADALSADKYNKDAAVLLDDKGAFSDIGVLLWKETPTEQEAAEFAYTFAQGYVHAQLLNPLI